MSSVSVYTPKPVNSFTTSLSFKACDASMKLFTFGRPLRSASLIHSLEYPSPENNTLLCFLIIFLQISNAFSRTSSTVLHVSNSSEIFFKECAMIVFKTVFAKDAFMLEPSILNSNLFPVKATGEVLFLSVLS